jgi:polyhydroxybutyrate depolymerase
MNQEPQEFPSSVQASLQHDGLSREYQLHIPPNYNGNDQVPLVIVLHGGGGTATNIQGFTQMNPVSDDNGFIAAYPQGFARTQNGFSWADGRATNANNAGIDDIGFLVNLIEQLKIDYRINQDKIYITGFSNGGFMSQRMICERPELFAGVATLGATIGTEVLSSCKSSQSMPTILLLGDQDTFVPYGGGTVAGNPSQIEGAVDLANYWRVNNNCSTTIDPRTLPDINQTDNSTVTLTEFTDCDCDANVKLYTINGGGHTWPGVENIAYEMIAGETNEDINASELLWDFFDQFERCQ